MKIYSKLLPLFFIAAAISSCVPEIMDPEAGGAICPMVGQTDTLIVKMVSDESLPKEVAIELTNSNILAEESCVSGFESNLSISEDRKIVIANFNLAYDEGDFYFLPGSGIPQEDYADFRIYKLENCTSEKELFYEKTNVAITWLRSSKYAPGCKNESYHGASEFKYRP
ncbi:MAG: hypothetical protein K9K67_02460 [Bacteriovoracaceae bacterium]|nr:hypothetical protein [Bacteriovoracaceae bacterium]